MNTYFKVENNFIRLNNEKMDNKLTKITKPKSRHLTTYEFFEVIQIEYLCAQLRARIYPKPHDKTFWNRVAEGKKQTIESIASRNRLPSIFTDSDQESALSRRVYRENTYPIFTYRDEQARLNQEYFDLLYYYDVNTDVRFVFDGEQLIGKVKNYKPFDKNIVVDVEGKEYQVPISIVSRIL